MATPSSILFIYLPLCKLANRERRLKSQDSLHGAHVQWVPYAETAISFHSVFRISLAEMEELASMKVDAANRELRGNRKLQVLVPSIMEHDVPMIEHKTTTEAKVEGMGQK